MKLLVAGDWHYRAQPPVSRLDEFQETLNAKIREVGEIAKREDCEAIIEPGDITDSPSLAYSTLTALENVVRALGKDVWSIPGNHDEHAHSLESLDRTAYGHLVATGLVRDLSANPAETDTVLVEGAGFSAETDNDLSDYLTKNPRKHSVIVHVAHGMLLERKPGFELKHTLLEQVAKHPQCPDVLIVGHEHLGFGVKRIPRRKGGELVAINPGALIRLSAHPGEMERTVQVCVLEVYPGTAPACHHCDMTLSANCLMRPEEGGYGVKCPRCGKETWVRGSEYGPPELWSLGSPVIETTLIPLTSVRPAYEVLSREHLELAAAHERQMDEFMSRLQISDEERLLDILAILEWIVTAKGLPEDVRQEGLQRIAVETERAGRGRAA